MASKFKLQIVHVDTGKLAEWEPGRSVEVDFITDCVNRILGKGVGFFRTQDHVAKDIQEGLQEAILALKTLVKPS